MLDLAHKSIDSGKDQTMTVSVVDWGSNSVIHDVTVRGEVFTPSNKFMSLEKKITGEDGKVMYSWPIDNNAETGEFSVVIRVSADGYEPISVSDTYKVRPNNRAPI